MQLELKKQVRVVIWGDRLVKFIKGRLKHRSTRVNDILKLEACLATLEGGNELDSTQVEFINALYEECRERNRRYRLNAKQRKEMLTQEQTQQGN